MRILFAISDSDFVATNSKAFLLAARLGRQLNASVSAISNEPWVADAARALGLAALVERFEATGVTIEQRLTAIDKMIDTTRHIVIPDTSLPLWKLLALDDFAGSLLLHGTYPATFPECDVILMPIMGIDSNTKGGCGMYVWLASEAQKRGIPVVGIEISPLGNKQTMVTLPMAHYCIRDAFSRTALCDQGVPPARISLLPFVERSLLQMEQREFPTAYLDKEAELDAMLGMPRDRFVIFIPHHVAFLWEHREIFRALLGIDDKLSIILRVDPNLYRRQFNEQEMVMRLYGKEMNALPHVLIDNKIGPSYLLQRCHLVISALASNMSQWAAEARIPTIISQLAGYATWASDTTFWEPQPSRIPDVIATMRERGLFHESLANVVEKVVQHG